MNENEKFSHNISTLLIISESGIFCPKKGCAGEDDIQIRTKRGSYRDLGDLELTSHNGGQISLIPYIGRKAAVVVFWMAWCPVCRSEVPRLNRLSVDQRIKLIGVNEGDSTKDIKSFVSVNRVNYEVVVDLDGTVAKAFHVPGMPDCVIIGRSGLIVYRGNRLPENIDDYVN
jgi:peroxiredoxin